MARHSGFTLIELMVTISIAAILATMAVPSFTELIKNNRMAGQTNDMITDLNVARSESIKRGVRITMCISSNGTTCTGTSTSTNWKVGRLIFVDSNSNGSWDTGEEILRVTSAATGTIAITASTFSNTSFVQFRPSGATFSSGNFKICDDRIGSFGRRINVAASGGIFTDFNITCP